jgi:NAD-dependent SIR2 family protein deacetylase
MKKVKRGLKVKLTTTVDGELLERAKEKCEEKHITIAGVLENFLSFFTNPWVYCFSCGEKFYASEGELCAKCGWIKCPKCSSCRCGLEERTSVAIFHMRRVYEDLLTGRVKG